jgi:hypothetical protein
LGLGDKIMRFKVFLIGKPVQNIWNEENCMEQEFDVKEQAYTWEDAVEIRNRLNKNTLSEPYEILSGYMRLENY